MFWVACFAYCLGIAFSCSFFYLFSICTLTHMLTDRTVLSNYGFKYHLYTGNGQIANSCLDLSQFQNCIFDHLIDTFTEMLNNHLKLNTCKTELCKVSVPPHPSVAQTSIYQQFLIDQLMTALLTKK